MAKNYGLSELGHEKDALSRTASPSSGRRRLWWAVVAIAVVVAVTVGAMFETHLRAAATPKVTWSQENMLEFLLPNQTRTTTVTFRSDQTLNNVAVFVTPALSPVLKVSPSTFPRVATNQPYQLTLTLKAGAQTEVKFDGAVQIKSTGTPSSTTYAQPLPLTIAVHNRYVPPDPGPANDLTIAGVDSDADGVRDDVQRYIVSKYLGQPLTIASLTSYASVTQTFITTSDTDSILSTAAKRRLASACWDYRFPTDSRKGIDNIRILMLNTVDRFKAYSAADAVLGGHSVTVSPTDEGAVACRF